MTDAAPDPAPATARRTGLSPRTTRLLLVALGIVVVGGIIWFVRYQTHGRYLAETNDAYVRADAVTISARVTGYVDAVLVGENQDVTRGQPLARIDARDYRAQAAQYQAQIDLAAANAQNARAGIAEQRAAIDQARAQLASARADRAFASAEVARYAPLAESGAEPREKLASLRNQLARADANVAAGAAALAAAQRRVASLDAQEAQARAQGAGARAQYAAADVDLGATTLVAPVAGRVGDRTIRSGQFVQPGLRLMSVVPLDAMYVVANFKETQIGLMRPGQPATIEIDALPGLDLHGHVDSLAPGTGAQFSLLPPQNATGNFTKIVQRIPVRIAIDASAADRRLLVPGMSVTVTVDTIGAKRELDRAKARRR